MNILTYEESIKINYINNYYNKSFYIINYINNYINYINVL